MPHIQLKLLGALAGLVLAIVVVLGISSERSLRERELAGRKQSLEQRAELARALLSSVDTADPIALASAAAEAARAAGAHVTLIDREGRVVGDSELSAPLLAEASNQADRPEIVAALSGAVGVSSRRSAKAPEALLYLALPPSPATGNLVVRLQDDLGQVDAAVAALRQQLAVAGALGLVAALAISFALSRLLLRPLEEVRRVVSDVANGVLDRRTRWSTRGDLGEIAVSIDRVAEQLRARLDDATTEKTRLAAVLGSMVEGVLVVDDDGRITLANPRLQELLGVWSDPVGRTPLELIRNEAVHQALTESASSREPQVCEVVVGKRILLMHAAAVAPSGGGGCVAVFRDVSEIRKLDQVRRDFLANASHELRTPLTSIQGFAATLQQEDLPPEERRRFIEVVVRNAERLRDLIDDLLELSRIEGRREPIRCAEVDVAYLARVLIEDLRPRLAQRSLAAHLQIDAPPLAWGDRRAIEQILSNLLDNAVKYTDAGGQIDVVVRGEPGRVEVVVSDTGVGIPENEIDRVFERFYRVDKARSRALGGTGLGLSIVKHLLQAMQGDIRLESKLGEGSRFTFWVPAAPSVMPSR